MPESTLVETLDKVRRHPWWTARAELALAVMKEHQTLPPKRILDVGCGWGVNLKALEESGYQASGLDISPRILQLIDQPDRKLFECDLNQPFPAEAIGAYDGLLVLDVIEHLDDDKGTLRHLASLVKPGGLIIVSVPALPELFSDFDSIQGHRRRYLPETLRAAFDGSGFTVNKIFWWGAWMVPILKGMRKKPGKNSQSKPKTYSDYLRVPSWPVVRVMKLLFALEKKRAMNGRLSTGTSLFAVGTREQS